MKNRTGDLIDSSALGEKSQPLPQFKYRDSQSINNSTELNWWMAGTAGKATRPSGREVTSAQE
ncbi:MAG: hypothetical protein AB8B50_00160 [Pirellulaceae bacterium]